MKRSRKFVIQSLSAAGFVLPQSQASMPAVDPHVDPSDRKASLIEKFRLQHEYSLAGHRSHSSHRSHGSHRSSSGGSRYTPSYSPPPPPPPPPPARSNSTPPASVLPDRPSSPKTLPGNSAKFTELVRRVQAGLYARGYYNGSLDGIVGPETRSAIMKFELDNGLSLSGTVSKEVLDALGIQAK
ncbi:MAG: His-Xaa-Ser repeat protein HxsA [Hyphomonas sp.]|nr:His-Xaa-Ser repeat protein HxsA [Hyphomonas sp.]